MTPANLGSVAGSLCAVLVLIGCALPQTYSSIQHRSFDLLPGSLEKSGIAFITPSTVTGQEEEKQAIAITFCEVLEKKRPDIPLTTLPQTLSAVNRHRLDAQYTRMFSDYRDTGLFTVESLRQIGEATRKRYLGQIKLSGFAQETNGRLSVFGLRVFSTKQARMRLFFQIWDSTDGSIVWEGMNEIEHAEDTALERAVTLKRVIETAAGALVDRLPENGETLTSARPARGSSVETVSWWNPF